MTGTGDPGPPGDPAHAPLSLELLADLHAGVLDEQLATQLRHRVATDAQARTVLAALDATVADLAALPRHGAVRMPDALALRLDAALAAEPQVSNKTQGGNDPAADPPGEVGGVPAAGGILAAPVADFGARRRRRRGWSRVGLAAAAAAIAVLALGVLPLTVDQLRGVQLEISGTPRAGDALGTATGVQPAEPMALTRGNLGGALDQALAARDFGPLSPPGMMPDCLTANGVADTEPLGALEITLDGRPGVLIVLPTGRIAEFRLLVVGPDCGPGNPSRMADAVAGRR